MKNYEIYRTYLVRVRLPVEASSTKEAQENHRALTENRLGSCRAGSVEVLCPEDERFQLGTMSKIIPDLVVIPR